MKKLLLIALASTFCLFSCSNDDSDDNSTIDPSALIGKWKFESAVTNDGIEISLDQCNYSEISEFYEDNTYRNEQLTLEENECVVDNLIISNYTLIDDKLTISNANDPATEVIIQSLTDEKFVVKYIDSENDVDINHTFLRTSDPFISEL